MTEIAELVKDVDMMELASKTVDQVALTAEESELTAELDARFKEIGRTGHDADHEISAFIRKTLNEEINNAPEGILDRIFNRDSIGEFDDYEVTTTPKNTLVAHEAAAGGNVERSFLDISALAPVWRRKQIETDLSFADLRRNGWKSVALYTTYADDAFMNYMFEDIMNVLDTAIASGAPNYILEATSYPTEASMDAAALYLHDRVDGDVPVIIGLNKYMMVASKLQAQYFSEAMKTELHGSGFLGKYNGVDLYGISGAKKLGNGDLLIPDSRMFGIAGQIGSLTRRGDVNVYQVENPNTEQIHILFKDFVYGFAFNADTLQKVCKVVLQ